MLTEIHKSICVSIKTQKLHYIKVPSLGGPKFLPIATEKKTFDRDSKTIKIPNLKRINIIFQFICLKTYRYRYYG